MPGLVLNLKFNATKLPLFWQVVTALLAGCFHCNNKSQRAAFILKSIENLILRVALSVAHEAFTYGLLVGGAGVA